MQPQMMAFSGLSMLITPSLVKGHPVLGIAVIFMVCLLYLKTAHTRCGYLLQIALTLCLELGMQLQMMVHIGTNFRGNLCLSAGHRVTGMQMGFFFRM